MSNKRLMKLLSDRGGELKDTCILDCYHSSFSKDVAYTILTNINTSNLYLVYEIEHEEQKVGATSPE